VPELDHARPIQCTVDRIRRIFVQAGMGFRGIATTENVLSSARMRS
jgi:hypothetical protein